MAHVAPGEHQIFDGAPASVELRMSRSPNAPFRHKKKRAKRLTMRVNTRTGLPRSGLLLTVFSMLAIYSQKAFLSSIQAKHRLSSDDTVESHTTSHSESSSKFPLIIGAGQGTTGTRSMHAAMCSLGIPSVHFNQACFRSKRSSNSTLFENVEPGIIAHYDARASWRELTKCVSEARSRSSVCNSTIDIITTMTHHVTKVVKSGVAAVHDVPYVLMIPYIMQVAKEERGVEPILLLTERNPQEWAKRRVQKHRATAQLVCKDPKGAFDFDHCLQYEPSMENLLTAYTDFEEKKEQEEYIALLADAMTHFQEDMLQLSPAFHINLFELEPRIDKKNLTQLVWDSTKSKLSSEAVEEINIRRRKGGLEEVMVGIDGGRMQPKGPPKKPRAKTRFGPYAKVGRTGRRHG
jgi:hypothetical protein